MVKNFCKSCFHLPYETKIYVPTTRGGQKRISPSTKNKRVKAVRGYMARKFGGYTSVQATGGYIMRKKGKGRLVKEPVVIVTAFSTKDSWRKYKQPLVRQTRKWGKKWGQESIGLEHEGDLYYVES